MDMGVPPFLVASTINVAMGQRLVRRLCEKCKVDRKLTADELKSIKEILPDIEAITEKKKGKFFSPKGCVACNGSGYLGRIGVREVLETSHEIQDLIMKRASAADIKAQAMKEGMVTMVQDGFLKAAEGLTTIEEVIRIIHE
jgi:type IV pilus assembly protein PilB